MALLRSQPALLWLLAAVTAHVTEAAGTPRRRTKLTDNEVAWGSPDGTVHLGSRKSSGLQTPAAGPEPGDLAAAFKVPTLDGEFSYQPGALQGPVVLHAFTNKSAFLECLWSSESSLNSLVEGLPGSTQMLFLSLDDSAVSDALWMREQLQQATVHRKKEVLSRMHFSPVPVFALGNWIPSVLYYWACMGHNCGLSQAVFTSEGWNMPVIVKRLDARYDWLTARWGPKSYPLIDAGDGCEPSPSVAGAVAWVSEGNCSFFTKVQSMATSSASGVLVYSLPGNPIQDMNCVGEECYTPLGIPAAMVHEEPSVAQALRFGQQVNVSFQATPSPNFFVSIDQQGVLAEMGWLLYPSFSFINWLAQWLDFYADLQTKLQSPAQVVAVFDKVQMQGEKGAVATVDLPLDFLDFDTLELDASLSCPGKRDSSCAQWDHTVQLFVCCEHLSPYCNMELGRWITAFRRGIGRWLTDVSPLIPLLDSNKCTFTMKTAPWAMPWIVSLNLRFTVSNQTVTTNLSGVEMLRPFRVMSLYSGGTFDKNYNKRFHPIKFPVPASTKKVELFAVITGHGSDEYGCGEFCVTSHHFLINAVYNNTRVFDSAGTALGCAMRVKEGAVPNEHGTWLYGRGGWCDGLQVNPWRVDITQQLDMSGFESNTVVYFGLFDSQDPNPAREPGYFIMSSFLVFYKGIGRWLTDVSPLIPLLDSNKCTFTMKTAPWAMPWIVSLNLRFTVSNQTVPTNLSGVEMLRPFRVMSLYSGGTFDKNYNKRFHPIKFPVPASTKKVELFAVITGHGSDEYGCGEFCVTSHHFLINAVYNNTRVFDSAGTALGCAMRVKEGAVPNEHGTWLYGRGGWCDGLQVNPWRVDITQQLDMSGFESNTVVYFGLFDRQDPNPAREPGYFIMSSFLVFYK